MENRDEQIREIIEETIRELNDIMNVNAREVVKDLVKKAIGRSVRTKDPLFWPSGLLMLGLVRAVSWADRKKDLDLKAKILGALSAHTDLWLNKYHGRIRFVDDALAGYCFVQLYLLTGDSKYKEAADKIAEYLDGARRDMEKVIIYNPGRAGANIFADGVGQVSMFYAAYAVVNSYKADPRYIEEAALHLRKYIQYGLDKRTSLNYHGYELKEPKSTGKTSPVCERKGIIGWSRAYGWLMFGLSETAVSLSKNDMLKDNEDIIAFYRNYCEMALGYQRKDGAFSWQLPAMAGHVDMSATGMIIYSIKRGYQAGILKDMDLKKALDAAETSMLHHTISGKVMHSLSSCDDFAVHYQTYGAYPWGQGAVLAALL